MKRLLRPIPSFLIAVGIGIALWPVGQIACARWSQNQLRAAWREEPSARSSVKRAPKKFRATGGKLDKGKRVTRGKQSLKGQNPSSMVPTGAQVAGTAIEPWPSTRIIIPEIGLDAVVVQGVDEAALRRGPGHVPSTGLPGAAGNCAIAAHRNVYGSWFYRITDLYPGAKIILRTRDESFDYEVMSVSSVADTDGTILRPPADTNALPLLTLITCTVPRTSTRIIVTAQLAPDELSQ